MRPTSSEHSSAEPNAHPLFKTDLVYGELPQAHTDASVLGQPLLTEVGVGYVRRRLRPASDSSAANEVRTKVDPAKDAADGLPRWDRKNRQLWLGGRLLKTFRQPAPNQTILLDVFEEEGWHGMHIDDPLPRLKGEYEGDAKRRLHETIKNLNRSLPPGSIRFHGDGTGQGVMWMYDPRPPSET